MPFFPGTPESLLERSDSKNPLTTCRGITSSGRPCRRPITITSSESSPTSRPKPTTLRVDDPSDEDLYCWQHKEQASASAKSSPGPGASHTPILEQRTSVDELADRLNLISTTPTKPTKPAKRAKPVKMEKSYGYDDRPHNGYANGYADTGGRRPPPSGAAGPKPMTRIPFLCCWIPVADETPTATRPVPLPVQPASRPPPRSGGRKMGNPDPYYEPPVPGRQSGNAYQRPMDGGDNLDGYYSSRNSGRNGGHRRAAVPPGVMKRRADNGSLPEPYPLSQTTPPSRRRQERPHHDGGFDSDSDCGGPRRINPPNSLHPMSRKQPRPPRHSDDRSRPDDYLTDSEQPAPHSLSGGGGRRKPVGYSMDGGDTTEDRRPSGGRIGTQELTPPDSGRASREHRTHSPSPSPSRPPPSISGPPAGRGSRSASATSQSRHQHLDLIRMDLLPLRTIAALTSELAKPVSEGKAGYIYIYFKMPEPATPASEAASAFLADPTTQSLSNARRLGKLLAFFAKGTKDEPQDSNRVALKIGRTDNIQKRMNQWDRQCGDEISLIAWYPELSSAGPSMLPCKVPHPARVEKLIHLELKGLNMWAGNNKMCRCGTQHREWFEVDASRQAGEELDEVVQRWVKMDLDEADAQGQGQGQGPQRPPLPGGAATAPGPGAAEGRRKDHRGPSVSDVFPSTRRPVSDQPPVAEPRRKDREPRLGNGIPRL
ncbi:meiotically up-regulated gene 113-domain-containing protein [Apodospora peruviana]|uniref:Meiotically up-regulated gene 113-domain-containing protein n=1 Tax=Apodospora peruviana TaxID=516989 RepID=A0AAE0IJJ9_9PEZI|nr:meiotically up-regulated gene 113-domain-containing protein [Apodospora peruviana]